MDENAIYGLISSYCDLDVNVIMNNSTISLFNEPFNLCAEDLVFLILKIENTFHIEFRENDYLDYKLSYPKKIYEIVNLLSDQIIVK